MFFVYRGLQRRPTGAGRRSQAVFRAGQAPMSTYDRQATDGKALFFRTTRCNKPFERPANTLCQILQLIISAHRLPIFGIRRFDNMNYFKVYKRISVRKICIEIDHSPMESSTSRTASFNPPSPHIFARYSSQN